MIFSPNKRTAIIQKKIVVIISFKFNVGLCERKGERERELVRVYLLERSIDFCSDMLLSLSLDKYMILFLVD